MELENSGFHVRKNFSGKLSEILAGALKNIRQSYPRPKKFKEHWFQWGAKLLACRRRLHVADLL
jgi:hypothetical protein